MCRAARAWLAEHAITHREVNVAADGKARYLIRKLTGRTRTPVFVVGDEVVADFDEARLRQLLLP